MSATAASCGYDSARFQDHLIVEDGTDTLAGALAAAWTAVCDVIADPSTSRLVLLPKCKPLSNVDTLQSLYDHLTQCQDCCEKFGAEITLAPHRGSADRPVALEVTPISGAAGSREGGSDYEFADDPDWDDDWDIDTSLLSENISADLARASRLTAVPDSDAEILQITKAWNQAVITGMGVCPFAVSAEKAGLPVGGIHYPISHASTAEAVYRDYWAEVQYLLGSDEREVSTTLLVTPHFGLENVEAFDILTQVSIMHHILIISCILLYRTMIIACADCSLQSSCNAQLPKLYLCILSKFAAHIVQLLVRLTSRTGDVHCMYAAALLTQQTLTEPLELLGLESDIQLVFFHPQHTFRDGQDRLGSAGAANFARRSPFPMVNILRTPQVRLAQKSIPTGLVYQQNEEVLESVGAAALQSMLEARDWEALSGKKVDRKKARVDYYSTARALQGLRDKDEDAADVAADVAAEVAQPVAAATATATASSGGSASMQSELSVLQGSSGELSGAAVQYDSAAYSSDEQAAAAAVSSAEDMKAVTTALVMRLMRRKPLEASAFETFSAAVDRMLAANER
jgi:hypothetical protein